MSIPCIPSDFTLPFLLINLGGEMIYILNQRLEAQNIQTSKAQQVRKEIVQSFLSNSFILDIFTPQPIYTWTCTRQLFERLAHSSIMKLQKSSMDKLFDLMVMGLKHQILSIRWPEELMTITLNHLNTIVEMVCGTDAEPLAWFAIDQLNSWYGNKPSYFFNKIRQVLLRYLQNRMVKVSLFLAGGIQQNDGCINIIVADLGPPGVSVPGLIKWYKNGQIARQYTIQTAITAIFVQNNSQSKVDNETCKYGLNMYNDQTRETIIGEFQRLYAMAPQDFQTTNKIVQQVNVTDTKRQEMVKWELDQLDTMIRGDSYVAFENGVEINILATSSTYQKNESQPTIPEQQARVDNSHLGVMHEFDGIEDQNNEDEDLFDLVD